MPRALPPQPAFEPVSGFGVQAAARFAGEEDAAFEATAEALGRLWLQTGCSVEDKQQRAQSLIEQGHTAQARDRLQALSEAYGAMFLTQHHNFDKRTREHVEAVLARQHAQPWPRALELAEAAWCHSNYAKQVEMAPWLDRLLASLTPAAPPTRPPLEGLSIAIATLAMACGQRRFDLALQIGVRAGVLAQSLQVPSASVLIDHWLAYVCLSVGDAELAIQKLQAVTRSPQRRGPVNASGYFDLLLTLIVAESFDTADQLLDQEPWIEQDANLAAYPEFSRLLASVHAHKGRVQAAERMLAWPLRPGRARAPAVGANMAWLAAGTHLHFGRHEAARALLLDFLASPDGVDPQGDSFSPMNGTQVYRLLSQAHEALGDLRSALDALKRSQHYSHTWVRESVRIRLQMLHLEAQPEAPEASRVQSRRVQAVQDAVQALDAPDAGTTRAADQLRWVAQVTHEVRNPAVGVEMMTSLLKLSDLDAQQRRYAELAHSSAQMVLTLCNDLLDLAKIDAGRFELHPEPTDVRTLLDECLAVHAPQMAMRGVDLQIDVDPALPASLCCDALRLRQVVMNLLGNAAKFTERGHIAVQAGWLPAADGHGGLLKVAVQDSGRGIAPEVLARLFREFEQGDGNVARTHGGSGLGLALCRSLVELMGGRIGADSTPGLGSRFWFELPLLAG